MGKGESGSLQFQIPQELKRKLAIDAAREGISSRALILGALSATGYEVPYNEFRDKQKGRK